MKTKRSRLTHYQQNTWADGLSYELSSTLSRVSTLTTFYLTVSKIFIPSLKSIGQFNMPELINEKIVMLKMNIITFLYWFFGQNYGVATLSILLNLTLCYRL